MGLIFQHFCPSSLVILTFQGSGKAFKYKEIDIRSEIGGWPEYLEMV
jgi:hypothetical protein